MNKKNIIKKIISFVIIILALTFVLYFSLKDNYHEIMSYILNMKPIYFIIAVLLMISYHINVAISMKFIAKINNYKYKLSKSIQTNLIIPFFNGVTPFAGGGQPMTVYYLHDEGIPYGIASNIVLQNFIVYQTAFIIVSIVTIIYNNIVRLFPDNSLIKKLVILGFIVNLLVWVFSVFISSSKKLSTKIKNIFIKIINKIRYIKNKPKIEEKLNNYINSFYENTKLLRKNKLSVCLIILLNIFGLLFLYSIPFFIALGMGEININIISIIILVTYVMVMGSFVPIPGGTGGIEYGFVYFGGFIFSGNIIMAIMLIWRFITYYLAMIIGAIAMILYRKKEIE